MCRRRCVKGRKLEASVSVGGLGNGGGGGGLGIDLGEGVLVGPAQNFQGYFGGQEFAGVFLVLKGLSAAGGGRFRHNAEHGLA
jgi:hypothetical protein